VTSTSMKSRINRGNLMDTGWDEQMLAGPHLVPLCPGNEPAVVMNQTRQFGETGNGRAALAMARKVKMWRSLEVPLPHPVGDGGQERRSSPLAMPWTMVAESLIGSTACSGVVSLRRYACRYMIIPLPKSELEKVNSGMISAIDRN